MSEIGKQLARRWFEEVWNKQRREAIGEMLLPDAIIHEGADIVRGPEGFYPFFDRMQSAFSDIHITVEDDVQGGDKVWLRWSCTMRHTGSGLGMSPTQKQLHTTGISILKTLDDKVVEGWQNWDMLGLMQQINEQSKSPAYIAAAAQ
jgi:predicted ester cyclase